MEQFSIGFVIVILAAVFQGSFMTPMAYIRQWRWENTWVFFTLFGMIGFNWLLGYWSVPNLIQFYQQAPFSSLAPAVIFGLLWGVGAVCFGLGMAAVGLALGYAIIMGLVLSVGALVPLAVFHPDELFSRQSLMIFAGLVTMLAGIAILCRAGMKKDIEKQAIQGKITQVSQIGFKAGLVICIAAGVLSSLTNIGYSLSDSLIALAHQHGATETWAGNSVWCLLFTAGAVANLVYCGYLFIRHKSLGVFTTGFIRNLLLVSLMAFMWIGSFVLYGIGVGMMGRWGLVMGWSVFIALSIAVAACWGILQGEWRGASVSARRLAFIGIAVLASAMAIFAVSAIR